MPPYKRLIAASSAAWRKEAKLRFPAPYSTSVVSVKAKLSPYKRVSETAAALDITLCPLVYSGKGGVCRRGSHLGSMMSLITVWGRITRLRYFSSQQEIKASSRVTAVK